MGRREWHVIGAIHTISVNLPGGGEVHDQEGLTFTSEPGGAKEGLKVWRGE